MGSQAFFASRWVIVVIWLAGVLPLVMMAASIELMAELNIAVFLRAILGILALGAGVLFLAAAWRVAAYPLLLVGDEEISITKPFARDRALTISRRGIQRVSLDKNQLVFQLHDGRSYSLRLALIPSKDHDDIQRLLPVSLPAF